MESNPSADSSEVKAPHVSSHATAAAAARVEELERAAVNREQAGLGSALLLLFVKETYTRAHTY
jgi:hypothetical protein